MNESPESYRMTPTQGRSKSRATSSATATKTSPERDGLGYESCDAPQRGLLLGEALDRP